MKFFITYKPLPLCKKTIWAICHCGKEMTPSGSYLKDRNPVVGCTYCRCQCGQSDWYVPNVMLIDYKCIHAAPIPGTKIGYKADPSKCIHYLGVSNAGSESVASHLWVSEEFYNSVEIGQEISV